jgi:hypothetical protein
MVAIAQDFSAVATAVRSTPGQAVHRHFDNDSGKRRMSYNVAEPGPPALRLHHTPIRSTLASPMKFNPR